MTLLVTLDATLGAAHALSSDAPQKSLALVAVGGGGGRPHLKVVWCSTGNGVNQSLQGLLIDVTLLHGHNKSTGKWKTVLNCKIWMSRKRGLLTYQFFIVKCAGGHSRSDAYFSRVLDKRLQEKTNVILKIKLEEKCMYLLSKYTWLLSNKKLNTS